ncbi:cyclophilin-like domain-containing protein [Hysterangium stoloniferum]|nr:cyclophilin-like domain-containing protein [Hysterangium stoloniferum]
MNPRVFFDFAIDSTPVGRVIFELFADTAPKTSENFRALCTGEKGVSAKSQLPLYYKNSIIHRSIAGFMVQGGDFTKRNGLGGESIYGGPFEDEDLERPVDSEGLLVMANRGPNTNGSQFLITLQPCPHLDGKHCVFGRILKGFDEVVQKLAAIPTDEKDRPSRPVVIVSCGELERRKPPVARRPSPSPSVAVSESGSEERPPKRKRRKHQRDESGSEEDKGRARKSRHKKKSKKKDKGTPSPPEVPGVPRQETEEEYDARLEREENERIEAARKVELARLRDRLAREKEERERAARESGAINYKG